MNILVITDLYPVRKDELYTPRTIYNFVKAWKNLGHNVKIIKPNFLLNSFMRKKPFYKTGIYGDVENVNYWLPFLNDISKKVKTELNAEAIIAHMPSGLIFANKLGLNFCAGVHNSDIEVLTNPLYKLYFKNELEKAYKNAKRIACRSYVLKDKFLKLYPQYESKTFAAPSGIGLTPVYRGWNPTGKIKVLTCAQLIKRKNIDKVINACEDIDNIELTVIGSGVEYNRLSKLSKKVIFVGQLGHDAVLAKMRESDIFVLPSVNETFGMVYMEAMASGCITVCAKGDGIDGIIKDSENGFLTTPESLEKTLRNIINFHNKNTILRNSYETMLSYNQTDMAQNYIAHILQ